VLAYTLKATTVRRIRGPHAGREVEVSGAAMTRRRSASIAGDSTEATQIEADAGLALTGTLTVR